MEQAFENMTNDIESGSYDSGESSQPEETQAQESQQEEVRAEGAQEPEASSQETSQEQENLTELEKLERFKFEGQEFTPKDIREAMMRQSDYTKKTQEVAENRKAFEEEKKFYDNLSADLGHVRSNPALAEQFKRIYPEKFHSYLDVLGVGGQQTDAPTASQGEQKAQSEFQLPPEIQEKLSKVDSLEQWRNSHEAKQYQQEVDSKEKQLEAWETEFSSKYPRADQSQVYGVLQSALDKGEIKSEQVTKDLMDKLYRQSHEAIEKRFESWQKEVVEKQKASHEQGRDIGKGGGTPDSAPKIQTLKDADAAVEEAIAAGKL